MTVNFLVTIDAGPSNGAAAASHPSFRRLCGLLDGHGIAATWMLDANLTAGAVAGIAGPLEPDLVSALKSMTTPQDMAFVDPATAGESDDLEFGLTHRITAGQLRHGATGFARVIRFRRGLQRAVRTATDFHLVIDSGFLTSTGRSCAFLENILFSASEQRAAGRIKFATIEEIRLITGDLASNRRETAA